jgi:hypothetical protein
MCLLRRVGLDFCLIAKGKKATCRRKNSTDSTNHLSVRLPDVASVIAVVGMLDSSVRRPKFEIRFLHFQVTRSWMCYEQGVAQGVSLSILANSICLD